MPESIEPIVYPFGPMSIPEEFIRYNQMLLAAMSSLTSEGGCGDEWKAFREAYPFDGDCEDEL